MACQPRASIFWGKHRIFDLAQREALTAGSVVTSIRQVSAIFVVHFLAGDRWVE